VRSNEINQEFGRPLGILVKVQKRTRETRLPSFASQRGAKEFASHAEEPVMPCT
jgi:hypothetical protein